MATQKIPPKKATEVPEEPVVPEEQLLHSLESDTKQSKTPMNPATKKFIVIAVGIIFFGTISGFALAQIGGGETVSVGGGDGESKNVEKIVGLKDIRGKDDAEGKLMVGGIDGEGTHHLERPGGLSQNVYLTSSVVPLDDYVGGNVKIWGDTFAAQSAGWLIDVVRLEVLE